MAIHKPWDRPFFTLNGSVMTDGFSLDLAEGQFGIFDVNKQTAKGAVAVDSFEDSGKDNLFELRLGNQQNRSRSTSNKMYSSFPFHISDVVEIKASAPNRTTMSVDELVIGYNGTDADTRLKLYPGEYKEIVIELEGKALEYLGVPEGIATIVVPLYNPFPNDICGPEVDPCAPVDMLPVVNYAVQYLKDYEFRGGVKLTDYIEVTPVISGTGDAARYGINLKSKVFKLASGEALRDKIGYIEDSLRIKAGGGYITDFNWSTTGGRTEDRPFSVTYKSKYEPRTHVAGNMLDDEERAKTYFTGRLFNYDYMGRILTGNESNIINLDAQFVDYAVTLRRSIYSQGLSQRLEENITYHIHAEVGKHAGIEAVINALAVASGLPPVATQ